MDLNKEGVLLNSLMKRRLLKQNKNFIKITVGPAGSGKSYSDLRQMELWYRDVLKLPFPHSNVCFTADEFLSRLSKGKFVRGDILMIEEGGTNMGNLDFQSKISKAVNYVLQSYRNLNLILFINLPYMNMLNKQTRMLAHFKMETAGIDKTLGLVRVKPYWLQTEQEKGKVYKHFPVVSINGYFEPVQMLGYSMPSQYIIDEYERRKRAYVYDLINSGLETIKMKDKKQLTEAQIDILVCWKQGIFKLEDIGERLGKSAAAICQSEASMRKKGYIKEEFKGFEAKLTEKPMPNLILEGSYGQ